MKKINRLLCTLLLVPVLGILSGPAVGQDKNIVEVAVDAGDFTTLVAAVQAAGLDITLADSEATFTVFAPTDAAFTLLGEDTINGLLADVDTLTDILLYHVVPGQAVDAETAISLAGTMVDTANGDSIALALQGDNLFINQSQVVMTDIVASNGIIHVIDAVLLPPADEEPATGNIVDVAVAAGDFTTLVAAVTAAGLDTTLADPDASFTVFAPTDAAFAVLGDDTINALLADTDTLTDILLYHVIAGQAVDSTTAVSLAGNTVDMASGDKVALTLRSGGLFINNSQVVTTDIAASNGVIHVIDAVLLPPADPAPAAGNIVETAIAAGDFTTLIAAAQAAGLDSVLADDDSTFTVFAPTDAAFAALGDDTINALLADTDNLSDILLYHVISGAAVDSITATSLLGGTVAMANGGSVAVSVQDGALTINDSKVVVADVQATNGVIHVIDTVLIPASMDAEALVQSVYVAFYGRPADPAGLAWWSSRLTSSGGDLADILMSFSNSQEFTDRYGDLDNEALLNSMYQQLFGRDIDEGGRDYYVQRLDSGELTIQRIALDILNGALNEDLDIINAKLAASAYFTAQLADTNFSYEGNDAAEAVKDLLAGIDADTGDFETLVDEFLADSM